MTQSDTRNMEWERILALELESVRKRLWGKRGLLWKIKNDSLRLEKEYRQFLYLIVRNPGVTIVPWSQGLDDFWHEHILDTAKYAADCEYLGAGFIHHNPHVPKFSEGHKKAYEETGKLYREAFKEKIAGKSGKNATGPGCDSSMPVAFCSSSTSHAAGHHGCGGHGGGHGGHGCGGHGCGGHGGH